MQPKVLKKIDRRLARKVKRQKVKPVKGSN